MSSGAFRVVTYDTDDGTGIPGRLQPESITGWNPDGVGTVLTGIGRMKFSAGRRERGLSPRYVSGVWVTPPAGYIAGGSVKIPVMQKASLDDIALDSELAYLGATFRVTGLTNEKAN